MVLIVKHQDQEHKLQSEHLQDVNFLSVESKMLLQYQQIVLEEKEVEEEEDFD